MATVTFTATAPNGVEFTRTSPTMPYVAVLMVADKGSDNWGAWSWHKTDDAAFKASQSNYHQGHHQTKVVQAIPTAINGKVKPGDFADWPVGVPELVAAKLAKGGNAAPASPFTGEAILAAATEAAKADAEEEAKVAAKAEEAYQATNGAPVKAAKKASKKQLLGYEVHQIVLAALQDGGLTIPEGMDAAEAETVVANWLRWIPTPDTAWGGKARA
jgi:hypothetical protein